MSEGIIIALISSLVTLLGVALSGFIAHKQNERQDDARVKELSFANLAKINRHKYNKFLENKERLFCVLQHIQSGHSFTENYRLAQCDITLNEYNKHYNKMYELTLEAEKLISLYFPEIELKRKKLSNLENLLWGHQQQLFGHQRNNEKYHQNLYDQIAAYTKEIDELCENLMERLSELSFR